MPALLTGLKSSERSERRLLVSFSPLAWYSLSAAALTFLPSWPLLLAGALFISSVVLLATAALRIHHRRRASFRYWSEAPKRGERWPTSTRR